MTAKLKTSVLGATGYAGLELMRILARHPAVDRVLSLSRQGNGNQGERAADFIPPVTDCNLEPFSWDKLQGTDLLFLATPHDVSRALVPEAIARGLRVVDLSGAWRLRQQRNRDVYQFVDDDAAATAAVTRQAVYGLPELNRKRIAEASLVANPGCYATSVILALAPLLCAAVVDKTKGIISDSKSGVSGAGKEPTPRTHFVSVADNLSAYSVFGHRHTGEILEQLQLEPPELVFTPHLLPIPRGIFSTIYVSLTSPMSASEVQACFSEFYAGSNWVRLFSTPQLPQIRFCLQTNYCDIGFCLDADGRRLVLVSCIDNLLKGAAGQAVQNMNVMYGWDEKAGLN